MTNSVICFSIYHHFSISLLSVVVFAAKIDLFEVKIADRLLRHMLLPLGARLLFSPIKILKLGFWT